MKLIVTEPLKTKKPSKREILANKFWYLKMSAEFEGLTFEEFADFLDKIIDEFSEDYQKLDNLGFKYHIMYAALEEAEQLIEKIMEAERLPGWSEKKPLPSITEIERQEQELYKQWQAEICGRDCYD